MRIVKWVLFNVKFQTMNKRYQTLFDQAKSQGNESLYKMLQDGFWYEMSHLLAEHKKLNAPASNPFFKYMPSTPLGLFPQKLLSDENLAYSEGSIDVQPPHVSILVFFSLLSGISIGAGVLWLVVPHFVTP